MCESDEVERRLSLLKKGKERRGEERQEGSKVLPVGWRAYPRQKLKLGLSGQSWGGRGSIFLHTQGTCGKWSTVW